jgi:hypothetical protein
LIVETTVLINSCRHRDSGRSGDIRTPSVAKEWKSASGEEVESVL